MSVLSLVRTTSDSRTTVQTAAPTSGVPTSVAATALAGRRSRAAGRSRARVLSAPAALAGRVRSSGREAGMTTAEYAVGTVGACGFGGVLVTVLTSEPVKDLLVRVIEHAFHFGL
jgi:hypothetical protein